MVLKTRKLLFFFLVALFMSGFVSIGFVKPAYSATTLTLTPDTATTTGNYFTLNISINDVVEMHSWAVSITFRKIVTAIDFIEDTSFYDGLFGYTNESLDYNHYKVTIFSAFTGASTVSGSGVVATINFTAIYDGPIQVSVDSSMILDVDGNEITHTKSGCSVMVVGSPWRSYFQVIAPSNGVINTTATTTVYSNSTVKTVLANQATSQGKFDYFLLDGIQNSSNPIHVDMASDHNLSAIFHLPNLVFNTNLVGVQINIGTKEETTNSSGLTTIQIARGNYTLSATKTNYYGYSQAINVLDNANINIPIYPILYYGRIMPDTTETISLNGEVYDYGIPEMYYLDMENLLYCEPDSGETASVTFSLLHGTNYPRIEIEASHTNIIFFNLPTIWQSWTAEDLDAIIKNNGFLGFRINTTDDLTIIFTVSKQPHSIYKTNQLGQSSQFGSWSYANQNITLTVTASDPTFSFDYTTVGSELHQGAMVVAGFFSIVLILGMVAALREGVDIKHIVWMPIGSVILVILILVISQLPVMNA